MPPPDADEPDTGPMRPRAQAKGPSLDQYPGLEWLVYGGAAVAYILLGSVAGTRLMNWDYGPYVFVAYVWLAHLLVVWTRGRPTA